MELNKYTIRKIFEKNFQYPIVETVVGEAIKMDAISAFHFCNVTGAGYLDDPTYLFSPKGVMKILREAFQYNIVTGIFDRNMLLYSPVELSYKKSYLFSGKKYVLLKECCSEQEFREEIKRDYDLLLESGLETTDFIVFRIEAWKNGNGMECFLEYLACEYYKMQGYIVENQIPLVNAVGSPDFGGFKIRGNAHGFHIVELAMIRITSNTEILQELNVDHVIVGEAKTATMVMATQLEKYLNTSVFYRGYEMHPSKQEATKNCFGMINIAADYSINIKEPSTDYGKVGDIVFDYNKYMEWYQNNLKFYLIANLTNPELREFIDSERKQGKYTQKKIIDVVISTPMDKIVQKVKEVL